MISAKSLPEGYGKDQLPWPEYRGKLEAAQVLAKTLGFPVGLGADELQTLLKMADNWYQHVTHQPVLREPAPTINYAENTRGPVSQEEADLMSPPKHMIGSIRETLKRNREAKLAREAQQSQSNGEGVPAPEASKAVSRSDEAQTPRREDDGLCDE